MVLCIKPYLHFSLILRQINFSYCMSSLLSLVAGGAEKCCVKVMLIAGIALLKIQALSKNRSETHQLLERVVQ